MSLLSDIERLITEHGSAAILKERLELLRDQISASELTINALKKENDELRSAIRKLEGKLDKAVAEEQYIVHRGVFFKKTPNGTFEDTLYCPECRRPLHSLMNALPFRCVPCGFAASFTGQELARILKEL